MHSSWGHIIINLKFNQLPWNCPKLKILIMKTANEDLRSPLFDFALTQCFLMHPVFLFNIRNCYSCLVSNIEYIFILISEIIHTINWYMLINTHLIKFHDCRKFHFEITGSVHSQPRYSGHASNWGKCKLS